LLWALTVLALDLVLTSFTEDELGQGAGAIVLVLLPFLATAFIAMLVERVLLLIGAGHVPILRHAALSSPDYELVEVRRVLGEGKEPG